MSKNAFPKTTKWNNRREAAVEYVAHGKAIFPVWTVGPDGKCACGDPNCESPGKHPMTKNGFKDAEASKEMVKDWWGPQGLKPNIGMVTGAESGIVVLDSDVGHAKDGMKSLEAVGYGKKELGNTRRVRSQSGGYHFYYRSDDSNLKSKPAVFDGVDFKANDAYIIVPPSQGAKGPYTYGNDKAPCPLPEDLRQLLLAPKPAVYESQGGGMPTGVKQGARNDTLFKYCCWLRAIRLGKQEILVLAESSNGTFKPPLDKSEVEKLVESAVDYDPNFPSTQEGLAERFIYEYRHHIRYAGAIKQWYAFDPDSGLWKPSDHQVHKTIRQMMRLIPNADKNEGAAQ